MGRKGQNKIPDRWEQYCNIGKQIPGTKFICFKVPLKEEMVRNKAMSKTQWFTPAHLLAELSQRGQSLGLLIDLTNTDRYYDPAEVTYVGTKYVKINVTGQDLPSLKEVKVFFNAVDDFGSGEASVGEGGESGDMLIGVHCTHGVNRTGYLVCRYLIERKGWSAKKAVHGPANTCSPLWAGNSSKGSIYFFETTSQDKVKSSAFKFDTPAVSKEVKGDPCMRAQIDIEVINSDSSSTSDEDETENEMGSTSVGQSLAHPEPVSGPVPLPGWQLFQQMMMGVAQMQAMMRMPFTVPAGGQGAGNDEEESEEESSEEESEEEDGTSSDEEAGDKPNKEEVNTDGASGGTSRQGWEMGGKVELKPKPSRAQKRRARRRERKEEFKKMRKGKFWEIREMQQKKYGI